MGNSPTGEFFKAESSFRVRYAETDAMGITHHASYLVWLELARTEYCRMVGLPYTEISARGIEFQVTEVGVKYLRPSFFDNEITVQAWVENTGRVSCRFGYRVLNRTTGELCVEAFTEHASVDKRGKLTRLFPELYEVMVKNAGKGPVTYFNRPPKEKKI